MTNPGIVGPRSFSPTAGTLANRPAATGSGRRYLATDLGTGTSWEDTAPGVWTPLSPPMPGPSWNVTPRNLRYFRRAVARVRAGTAFGDIFCNGDSTTVSKNTASFSTAWPSVLTQMLNTYMVPTYQTWMFPHNTTPDDSTRIVAGSHWSGLGTATSFTNSSGISDTLSFSPSAGACGGPPSVDTFDIYTVAQNTYGSMTVNVDGGSTLATINSNNGGAGVLVKTTVTVTAGVHTLNIVGPSAAGLLVVWGVNAYLSTAKCLRVANFGVNASSASGWTQSNTSPGVYSSWYTAFAPDLTIFNLGINDAAASTPAATYQASMQTLITRGQSSPGDVALMSFDPLDGVGAGSAWSVFGPSYQEPLLKLAAANGCAFVDLYSRWVSYALSNPMGYYSDTVHPSTLGYADMAAATFDLLSQV